MALFGKKEGGAGAGSLPEPVSKFLIDQKWDPEWVSRLKAVSRANGKSTEIRVFDADEATAKGVKVKDYTSLDGVASLMLFEGSYDDTQAQLSRKPGLEVKDGTEVLSQPQIWRKLAGLSEPGSTAFFYLGSSPASGGPFGRGATIVERNPDYPGGKKSKKFNIYTVDVDGLQPKGKGQKLWDSDKLKDIVPWIAERHHPSLV